MANKSEAENAENPKSGSSKPVTIGNQPPGASAAAASAAGASASARRESIAGAHKGVRVQGKAKRQYLIASRRMSSLTPMGLSSVTPLALNMVEQALRSSPDIEVVDTLGPRAVVGTLADGLPGMPHVIVARMEPKKAEVLHQQGQGNLIVEADQPLALVDVPPFSAPMFSSPAAGTPPVTIDLLVIGEDEAPVADAEVYVYGNLLPAVGVTNSSGRVTLTVVADTPDSVRGLYVKPKGDYWSFYQADPVIDASQTNIVVLRPLSDGNPDFPQREVLGWGQKAMRLDQLPPDRRGRGIKVAIVDSGAATTHEDLRRISNGFDVIGKAAKADNWMVDTISHGSHCAGVIAGSSDNKIGIKGFAPDAEIHVCKIFPGGQISQLIDALEYCIEKQIDVVNLSLGTDQVSELLEQQLVRVRSLGIAVIAAAGNSGGPVQYPASSPNVLAVAAIGRLGEFPPDSYHSQSVQTAGADGYFSPRFTCFGPEIALCAPGVAVLSSVPPNDFAAWDGTSMAAPHVTGLAALVLAHHPDFSGAFRARNAQRVERLFQILKASARPIHVGDPRRTGFGIPDAPTALGLQTAATQTDQMQTRPQAFMGNLSPQIMQPMAGYAFSPFLGGPSGPVMMPPGFLASAAYAARRGYPDLWWLH